MVSGVYTNLRFSISLLWGLLCKLRLAILVDYARIQTAEWGRWQPSPKNFTIPLEFPKCMAPHPPPTRGEAQPKQAAGQFARRLRFCMFPVTRRRGLGAARPLSSTLCLCAPRDRPFPELTKAVVPRSRSAGGEVFLCDFLLPRRLLAGAFSPTQQAQNRRLSRDSACTAVTSMVKRVPLAGCGGRTAI